MPAPDVGRRYHLRRRLLLLISAFVALVVITGAGTVSTAVASQRAIAAAHRMELASRKAALLSVVVREQYIHEAHTIILRDRTHVAHHDEWVRTLDRELDELGSETEVSGLATIDEIRSASGELRRVFSGSILPAIDRGDWAAVRVAHERANALVDGMTRQADALAASFEDRAVLAEREAERIVRVAFAVTAGLGLLAALLAIIAGRSLWNAFAMPLGALDSVARQVTKGDRSARIGALEAAELAVVADAFNAMLDALARAEADVVASERLAAIGRIAAGVAHEINNPIAVIRGYVKTMRAESLDASLRDELSIVDEEAAACQRIAEDLRVYAHSPALEPAPVQAAELLGDSVRRSEEPTSEAEGAPPSVDVQVEAEPAMLAVDALRIRQVIVNLVNNAREATTGDEPVIVRGTRTEDGYRIEVLDRGAGLGNDVRDRIFEPFFTTRRNGTGLGLAVCHGLVTAHGGTIRAEPRAGGGSRFVVDLPGVLVEEEQETRS